MDPCGPQEASVSRGPASRFAGRAGPGLAPSALTRGFGGVSSCLGRGADGTAPLAFLRRVHLPAGLRSPLGEAVSGAWGSSGPLEGRGLCSLLWSRSAGASSTAEGHGRGRRVAALTVSPPCPSRCPAARAEVGQHRGQVLPAAPAGSPWRWKAAGQGSSGAAPGRAAWACGALGQESGSGAWGRCPCALAGTP